MSPRTEKQFEEIRLSKKALIQEVALELFAKKGYHSTSISMIAKKAGISKGLLYNYYESKEDLLNEIITQGMNQAMQMMDPNQDGQVTRDEMAFMINESFEILQTHSRFWILYFSLLPQAEVFEIVKDKFYSIYKLMISMLTDYFKKRGSDDPEAEAIILGSLLDGIYINYIFNPELFPLEAVKKKLIDIYCKK
ncbi:MAG: TetR/AcrR family transcriptional regulator [Bacteroidales bacterium]|nr:TetR/AcrR family transcriptional regulator [Bacteroidales bacterium]MCF8389654.1 TetR/AcrR family transcriptional regulator [Bacteroidales bacterium]